MMSGTINVKAIGIAGGVLGGVYLFLASLFKMLGLQFFGFNTEAYRILVVFHPYLGATAFGAIIGFVLGFVCVAVPLAVGAWLYNRLLGRTAQETKI